MSPTRTTPRGWLAGVLFPAALLGLVACNKAPPSGGAAMMPSGPPPVTVAAAVTREIIETDEFPGRFEATQQVALHARVNGYLQAVHFTPGQHVKAGDLLFEIDPAPFAARLAEAQASAGNTRAQLDLARLELARQKNMLPQRATSRREFEAAAAAVATLEAALQADEARIRAAQVELAYTRITAPIAGRMGKDELTIGNLVRGDAPDSPRLSTLVSMDPIYVSFEADEAAYLKYIGKQPQGTLKVAVGLADERGAPHAARLQFVDNQLDLSSGTVRLRAVLPNPDRRFAPGLYARVQLAAGDAGRHAVLVQDGAIGTDQSKRFVLVLDDKNNAQYREVMPGRLFEGLRVIESGLKAGERIVISGLQRVRPGSPVSPEEVVMDTPATSSPAAASEAAPEQETPAGVAAPAEKPATAPVPATEAAPPATPASEPSAAPVTEAAAPLPNNESAPVTVPPPAPAPAAATSAAEPAPASGQTTEASGEPAAAAGPAAAPAPAPAAAQTATPPYTAGWLQQQPGSKFVLQLLGSVDRAAATRFIKRHALEGSAAVIETQREGKPWFVVVTGLHDSSRLASRAIEQLAPALRQAVQPWPRAVKTLPAPAR